MPPSLGSRHLGKSPRSSSPWAAVKSSSWSMLQRPPSSPARSATASAQGTTIANVAGATCRPASTGPSSRSMPLACAASSTGSIRCCPLGRSELLFHGSLRGARHRMASRGQHLGGGRAHGPDLGPGRWDPAACRSARARSPGASGLDAHRCRRDLLPETTRVHRRRQ